MAKKIAVIDGNSLMHRAYHAVPPTMNAPDGTPTNAVFGFCSMLFKFIEMASPDAVICAFDFGKPKFRMEALKQYKAQRPPMDDELRVQFPVIESLLEAMAIPVVKIEGWEGDDILGTIAARDEAAGYETLLVSGDKDINQLVTPLTSVVTTKKGITDVVIFNPQTVEEKYGVTPAQFIDFLGIMGDTSDNIPGVPGIGPKSAQKLLASYGSMEGIYEHLHELKGKQLENLQENKDLAFLSREIATIKTDLDFELDLDAIAWPAFDYETVSAAFGAIKFSAQLERLMRLVGQEGVVSCAAQLELGDFTTGADAKASFDDALTRGDSIAVALHRNAQESLFDCGLTAAFAWDGACAVLEGEEAQEALLALVKQGNYAAVDVKAVLHELYPVDSSAPALISDEEILNQKGFDLSVAAYDLNSSSGSYDIDGLLQTYLNASMPQGKTPVEATAYEAQAVLALRNVLQEHLERDDAAEIYEAIDAPLISVLTIMERNGAPVDIAALRKLGAETSEALETLEQEIYELAGETFNISSPMQLARILFEVLELPHGKKNQRGYSTDAKVLKKLAEIHELPAKVLQYREFAKIKTTYIDALPQTAAKYGDGRVHTSFNETVTATGRLSSSDPNLQNIPVRTEFGKQIRQCFGPLNSHSLFMSADYSQIELRLLAHLSKDEHLIAAFNEGADFHANTAARVFGVSVEEVTPAMRSRAKAVNFGIVYGQQAFGLSQTLEISVAEAKSMIDRYFEAYPRVREYLDETVSTATEQGYAETMFGRRRYIPELAVKNATQRGFGERTAMNHPMQGSAADIIKMAMNEVQRKLLEGNLNTRLLIQVHDELDLSVPKDELETVTSLVKEAMEGVVSLDVPLLVDVSTGKTWAEAH